MNSQVSNNDNGDSPVEFEFDINDLREELGIPEIEAELASLRELLGEWLSYMNLVDLTVQELVGEPTVTESIAYNIPKGGRLEVQRQRPPIPSNLSEQSPALVQKPQEES
jgi:hypothetical protein